MKIHMVKKGDSLYSIAQKYNVSLEELIQANPEITNPDVIDVGMKVKIPMPATPAMEVMHQHKVQQGDTLWKLSKAWGIPLETLIKANPQLKNPNALLTGEMVNIPKVAAGEASSGAGTSASSGHELPPGIEGWMPGGKANTGVMPDMGKGTGVKAETGVMPQPAPPVTVTPEPAPAPMPAPEIHLPPIQIHYEHIDLFKQYPVPAVEAAAPVHEQPKTYGHHHGYGTEYGAGYGTGYGAGYGHEHGYGHGYGHEHGYSHEHGYGHGHGYGQYPGIDGVSPAAAGMPGAASPAFPTQELAQMYASPYGGGGWVGETEGEAVAPAPGPVYGHGHGYGHGYGYGAPGATVSPIESAAPTYGSPTASMPSAVMPSAVSPAPVWPHSGCSTCTGTPIWPGSAVSPFAGSPAAGYPGYGGYGHGIHGGATMMPTAVSPSAVSPSAMPVYDGGGFGHHATAVSPLGTAPAFGPAPFAPFGYWPHVARLGPTGHVHGVGVGPVHHVDDCRDDSGESRGDKESGEKPVKVSTAPKQPASKAKEKAKVKSRAPRRVSKPKQKQSMPWIKW